MRLSFRARRRVPEPREAQTPNQPTQHTHLNPHNTHMYDMLPCKRITSQAHNRLLCMHIMYRRGAGLFNGDYLSRAELLPAGAGLEAEE